MKSRFIHTNTNSSLVVRKSDRSTLVCEIEQNEDKWIVLYFPNSLITYSYTIVKCETIEDAIQYFKSLLNNRVESIDESLDIIKNPPKMGRK